MSRQSPNVSQEERAARSARMRALNADPEFRRKGQGEWTPERRAAKSRELKARNADPAFQARRREGIAARLPRGLPIPRHSHPCVRGLFARMNDQLASRDDVARRAGISGDALSGWQRRHMPQIDTLDAALGALDLELAIVPVGRRDANGFVINQRRRQ